MRVRYLEEKESIRAVKCLRPSEVRAGFFARIASTSASELPVVPAANRVDQVDLLMRAEVVPFRNLGENAEPILAMPDLHRSIDEVAGSAVSAVGV